MRTSPAWRLAWGLAVAAALSITLMGLALVAPGKPSITICIGPGAPSERLPRVLAVLSEAGFEVNVRRVAVVDYQHIQGCSVVAGEGVEALLGKGLAVVYDGIVGVAGWSRGNPAALLAAKLLASS